MLKIIKSIQTLVLDIMGKVHIWKLYRRLSKDVRITPLTDSQVKAVKEYWEPILGIKMQGGGSGTAF